MSSTQVASPCESWQGLMHMMPDQFERLMATQPLRFIVGQDKTEFTIHTGLLPPLSAPLTALAHRGLKKSSDGYVALEEVDKDVFFRFMQFLYTGTYTSFRPDEEDDQSNQNEVMSQMVASTSEELSDQNSRHSPVGFGGVSRKLFSTDSTIQQGRSKETSHSTTLFGGGQVSDAESLSKPMFQAFGTAATHVNLFESSKQPNPCTGGFDWFGGSQMSNIGFGGGPFVASKHPQAGSQSSFQQKLELAMIICNCSPCKKKREYFSDFKQKYNAAVTDQGKIHCQPRSETLPIELTGHVRVWLFANSFDITALMNLASSRLAYELAQWRFQPNAFVTPFGDLVRCAYNNCSEGESQLTQVVAQYAACMAEEVSGLEGWPTLLEEVPKFAVDLVGQMATRVG